MLTTAVFELGQLFYHAADTGNVPTRSALALISLSRQNEDNCFQKSELPRNTILNMRSGRKVCKKWWDGFWMQTITQIPIKTYSSLF